MKIIRHFIIVAFMLLSLNIFAGNDQRLGQAGASELLINPWARSSGFGGVNTSFSKGLEATYLNVAGTAYVKGTEVMFSTSKWFGDININAFGIAQKVGKGDGGVVSLSVVSMNFGDIEQTTTDYPDGGIGTFKPQFNVISLSYAKVFSDKIYAGFNFKIIQEGISNLNSTGVAIDAGIQYTAIVGKKNEEKRKEDKDKVKLGVALKNIGPSMKYNGSGFSYRTDLESGQAMTVEQRSEKIELPSLITIGAAYEKIFNKDKSLTTAFNFTSNSFSKDQYTLGLEYSYKKMLFARAAYTMEKGVWNKDDRTTAIKGPSFGGSLDYPLNKLFQKSKENVETEAETKDKKQTMLSFDYSYRITNPFSGIHSFAVKLSF